jgi:hypothetical protein
MSQVNGFPDDTDAIEVNGQWPIDPASDPELAISTSARFFDQKEARSGLTRLL